MLCMGSGGFRLDSAQELPLVLHQDAGKASQNSCELMAFAADASTFAYIIFILPAAEA